MAAVGLFAGWIPLLSSDQQFQVLRLDCAVFYVPANTV